MRFVPEDIVEDPCDCVVVDHCDDDDDADTGSSLLPNDIIAGSVHGKFCHRSLATIRRSVMKIKSNEIYKSIIHVLLVTVLFEE